MPISLNSRISVIELRKNLIKTLKIQLIHKSELPANKKGRMIKTDSSKQYIK